MSVTDSGNGTPPHVNTSASQTFTIVVSPAGNQFPTAITDSDSANNTVPEGAANGTLVGITTLSIDPESANITYSLTDDAGGRFAINNATGIVTVANSTQLNFEDAAGHNISVQASDGLNNVSATFSIAVANVVPSAPVDVDSANNTVTEGAANGTSVGGTFSSTDFNGPNVTFTLTDDAGGRFAIDSATGVVTVANGSLLNFESATSHNITVQSADGVGGVSLANLTLSIQNVAPTSPFDSDPANNSISESAANGTIVGITASSADPNGGITYTLTDSAGGRFAIDPVTGIVTLANATLINFESASSHNITVRASDGAANMTTDFSITIVNVRPTIPADTNAAPNTLSPGAANGTLVGITTLSTEPKGPTVVYSLASNPGGRFAIDNATGVVTVADSSLITPGTYAITVQADEGAGSPSTANFLINVPVVPVQTLIFQQGVNNGFGSYSGTDDVQLSAASPDTTAASGTSLLVDFDAAKAVETHALLRFNNIIGATLGQIPANAIILDATLALFTNNPGDGGAVHRMQQSWTESATWNSFNTGISADGIEAATTFNAQVGNSDRNGDTVDLAFTLVRVTQDVQAWVNGETNNGWGILPWTLGTDGWAFDSSEASNAAQRPMLVVNYIMPGSASVIEVQQGVNGYASTVDTSLNGDTPATNYGASAAYFVDAVGVAQPSQVLLRFDNLVGSGVNQLPVNATVYGAVLTIASSQSNAQGDGGEFYRVNSTWSDADTWDTFGDSNGTHNALGGIQPDGNEAATTALANAGAAALNGDTLHGHNAIAVTADLQAWANGQTNNGWAILPWPGGGDGWGYRSAEATNFLERPVLRVVFNAAPTIAGVADQTIDEDIAANVTLTGITAGLSESQNIQITATSGNTSLLLDPTITYTSGQNNGTLTLLSAANQIGTTTVAVTVRDAGLDGVFNTPDDAVAAVSFNVTVNPVNDAPSFTLAGSPPVVIENAGLQTVPAFAGSFNPGPANEAGQSLLQYNVAVTATNGTLAFATPPSIDANGTLTYTPTPGTNGTATISVTVTDSGNGTAPNVNTSLAQTFSIFVSPAGNQFPSVPADVNSANNTILEGAPNGTLVGITASSIDPEGANITYSLTDSAGGRFAIDPATGVVSVANATLLNFETASQHNITVQANDGTHLVSTAFNVIVTNVAPTLPTDGDATSNSIAEGSANGTLVGVTAASVEPNSNVTYTLTDDAGGRFAIDSATGVVSVANATLLNFESGASHNITVQANDGAGGVSNQTFAIAVSNVAPTTPVDSDANPNRVAPNAINGTLAGITAFATEPNGPPVNYTLRNNAGGRFAIHGSTGVITLANRDLLTPGLTYTVTVQADDGGGAPASASFQIEVPFVQTNTFQQGINHGFGVYSDQKDTELGRAKAGDGDLPGLAS